MTIEYKIGSKSNWKYLYKILLNIFLTFLTIIAIVHYIFEIDSQILLKLFVVLFGWFFILNVLPLLVLYMSNLKYAKKTILIWNENDKSFKYQDKNETIKFYQSEVTKVSIYLTPPSYDNRFDIMFFGKYNFTKIFIEGKKEPIIISCLTCDKFGSIFDLDVIERKKMFLPIPPLS